MRRPSRTVHFALGYAVLALTGCAPTTSADPMATAATERPDDAVVELVGLDFKPASLTVMIGRRVRWQWTDSVVHNIISDDFASLAPTGGGSYAVTFDRAGTFPYRCTLHTGMDGTIIVTG